MTSFEKDLREIRNGNGSQILKRRKAEIERLHAKGRACKNSFRLTCIAQELLKLTEEYKMLDSEF